MDLKKKSWCIRVGLVSIFSSLLIVPLFGLSVNTSEDNGKPGYIGEVSKEKGPIFYPATYTEQQFTGEARYSSQNNRTFSKMNIQNYYTQYDGDTVKVAVIDSGLNYTHEDFISGGNQIIQKHSRAIDNTSGSWLYYQFDRDGDTSIGSYPTKLNDTLGHGTNVASVIASQINSVGCAGLAPNVDLYVYKVTNTDDGYEWIAIQNALQFCIDEGIDVVNMSFQAYEHAVSYNGSSMAASAGCSTVLTDSLNACYNAGITLVAAAGNFNTSEPSYPASNNHVISVGSLANTITNEKAGFSNTYGIDIVAPGYVDAASIGSNSSYIQTQGTSFSAPIVTAAIALYKQKYPSATPAQIESALYAACDPISGNPAWAGNGALNLADFLGISNYPTSIDINNGVEVDLEIGDTHDIDYTVNGVGTFDSSVTFESGDESVATVNSSGKITAVGEGECFITIKSVSDPSINNVVMVSVTAPAAPVTLESITLSGMTTNYLVGDAFSFNGVCTAHYSDESSRAVTPTSITAPDMTTAGDKTITVSYIESGVTKTASYTIKVKTQSSLENGHYELVSSLSSNADLIVGDYYMLTSPVAYSNKYYYLPASDSPIAAGEFSTSSGDGVASTTNPLNLSITDSGFKLHSTTTDQFKLSSYGDSSLYLYITGTNNNNLALNTATYASSYWTTSFNNNCIAFKYYSNNRYISSYNASPYGFRTYGNTGTNGSAFLKLYHWVVDADVTSIEVKTVPTKTTYEVGEYFDPTGLIITAHYDNSTSVDVSYASESAKFSFAPGLTTSLSKSNTSVTITYGGKSTTQAITVRDPVTLSSISVTNPKTSFVEGDSFSFGGTVTATYSDDTSSNVTSSTNFTGYDMTSVGNQTVTASYTFKTLTKTATYSINVAKGTLSSIAVSGQTTTYVKNAPFSFDGVCIATFANGYQKNVTPMSVSSPDMSTTGNKTITVSFTYNGVTKTTTYSITVNAYRTVMEQAYSILGSVVYTSGTQTISSSSITVSKSGYTTIENATTASSKALRLGSGSNTGTLNVNCTGIYKIVVNARVYNSDSSVTLQIGTVSKSMTQTYTDYVVEFATAVNTVAIRTTTNGKRVWVASVTVYTKTSQDIGQSEDCLGLESFINEYMHMDYTSNSGYCKDSEHHYYSSARTAFNVLNTHQRSLFVNNSAYALEKERLVKWASFNSEVLDTSTNTFGPILNNNQLINKTDTNTSVVLIIMIGSIGLTFAMYVLYHKKFR